MKKSFILFISTILALALLAGCAAPTPVAPPPTDVVEQPMENVAPTEAPAVAPTEEPALTPIIVVDALDRVVEFETLPTRIVIAGKAGFMLGNAAFLFPEAADRIISYVPGSQTSNDFIATLFPQASGMTQLETTSSPEQIAPLQPDVVLLKSYLKESLGDPLEQLGIKVVYLNLETPEAISKDIRTLGDLFGNSAKADDLIQRYEIATTKVTDVTNALTDDEKPSVLMLQYSDKGGEIAFKVPPLDWLQTSLVSLAGGTPVWKDVPTDGWTVITFEQIAAWNPQIILLIDYKGNAVDIVTNLKADEKWALLDAVKNNKIFAFPLDFQSWDQPDTRWTLGLTWVATKVHPDLFTNVNMTDEINSFYKNFYGFNQGTIDSKIMPLVKGDL